MGLNAIRLKFGPRTAFDVVGESDEELRKHDVCFDAVLTIDEKLLFLNIGNEVLTGQKVLTPGNLGNFSNG